MKRKFRNKAHNFILWTITYLMFLIFLISGLLIENGGFIAVVGIAVSLLWLLRFSIVNRERW